MALNPVPPPGEATVAALACGRDAALVWDRAAAGEAPDEHERACPHCGAAMADARGLDTLVHRLAAQPIEPPPSVMERLLGAMRTELLPHEVLTLPSPHGPAGLSSLAAAAVLRHTVDAMADIRARSCRIVQVPAQEAASPGEAHAVDVHITVTARFGVDLVSVTARVRQMVAAAGEQALGVPVRRVDIEVVDVFSEEDRT